MTLTDALARYPTLCRIGFGLSNCDPAWRWNSPEAHAALEEQRIALQQQRQEVETAEVFLAGCQPTVTPRLHSYRLKHAAESWGARHTGITYVSNGALILAALLLDLVVRPCEPASLTLKALGQVGPNAWIGVSVRSVDRRTAEPGAISHRLVALRRDVGLLDTVH